MGSLITMLGGATFGSLFKLITNFMGGLEENKIRAEQFKHEVRMAELGMSMKIQKQNALIDLKNPKRAWTKRVLALLITLAIIFLSFGIFQSEYGINVPIETTVKTTWLWIITTSTTSIEYINLKGGIYITSLYTGFELIVSSYYGASIIGDRIRRI